MTDSKWRIIPAGNSVDIYEGKKFIGHFADAEIARGIVASYNNEAPIKRHQPQTTKRESSPDLSINIE